MKYFYIILIFLSSISISTPFPVISSETHNNVTSNSSYLLENSWNNTFGSPSITDVVHDGIITSDGNFAFTGLTHPHYDSVWLVKVHENGSLMWNFTYSSNFSSKEYSQGNSVIETVDKGFLIAGKVSIHDQGIDLWIIKTDKDGYSEWNKTYKLEGITAQSEEAFDIIQTQDGGYIILGKEFIDTFDPPRRVSMVWLIKITQDGIIEWNYHYGIKDEVKYEDLSLLRSQGQSIIQIENNGFAFIGSITSIDDSGQDLWLVKLNTKGIMEWNRTFKGEGLVDGNSIYLTKDKDFIIVGTDKTLVGATKSKVLLIKTDSEGNEIWRETFGGKGENVGNDMKIDSNGDFVVIGYTTSYSLDGSEDILLLKTDFQGKELWRCTFGSEFKNEYGKSLVINNNYYLIFGVTNSRNENNEYESDAILYFVTEEECLKRAVTETGLNSSSSLSLSENFIPLLIMTLLLTILLRKKRNYK
jgi:regulation of enolase protein 1 (concanavalin A-like superfamily)